MARYDHTEIEPKWRDAWDEAQLFRAEVDPARPDLIRTVRNGGYMFTAAVEAST